MFQILEIAEIKEQFQNTPPFRADPFFPDKMRVSIYNDVLIRDAGQFSAASHHVFFLLRHCSWIYPYRDAGQFSGASQRFFVLRHHSWMYPYRDAGQFSDASHRVFLTASLFMGIPIS